MLLALPLLLGIIKFQCGFHYLFKKLEAFFNSTIILSSHFLNSFCPFLLFLLHLLIKQLPFVSGAWQQSLHMPKSKSISSFLLIYRCKLKCLPTFFENKIILFI